MRYAYKNTVNSEVEPTGSELNNMECSGCEKVRPFRSATGAHMECGHLF